MIEHLIVSTIVLIVAMLAARFLPLTARTRYAILFCGLAKFAIPTAVFRFVPVEVLPPVMRTFGGNAAAAINVTPAKRIDWLVLAWLVVASLLLARWLLLRTRTIAAALPAPTPPSPRELAAVADARATLRVASTIDVLRSPICEAPAVLRIVRPVIALPAQGCDDLSDGELRSLVLHECAHVARHDNFAALLQALATSLLWFHPLVWMASHALTNAREEACDERVADAMHGTDAYVSALSKLCHAIAAPRAAGASCMAGANLRERMEHLMSYESIRSKAWPHRAMIAIGIVAIAATTFAATMPEPKQRPYSVKFDVTLPAANQFTFDAEVTDTASGTVVSAPRLTTQSGVPGTMSTKLDDGREIRLRMQARTLDDAEAYLEVRKDDKVLQRTLYTRSQKTYDGEPVSLTLQDADIRDVLKTFGQLTDLTFVVAPDVEGSVTTRVEGVPWDKALDDLLDQHGLVGEIDGTIVHVRNKR